MLNILPCDTRIVDTIRNEKGITSLEVFNGYIQNNEKKVPQNSISRCDMTHLIYSLKSGKFFESPKVVLTFESKHDNIYEDTGKDRNTNGLIMVRMRLYVMFFHMLDIVKQWMKLQDLGRKIVYLYHDWSGNILLV